MKFSLLLCFFSVPPNIDDSLSSSDVIVREGSNITLKCRAHGSPQPTIKWKRDDNSRININKSLSGEKNFLIKIDWKFIIFPFLKFTNGTLKCSRSRGYHVWTWERIYALLRTPFHPQLVKGLKSVSTVSTSSTFNSFFVYEKFSIEFFSRKLISLP